MTRFLVDEDFNNDILRGIRLMKTHMGSSFESFLEEKGIKDDVERRARKEILAGQIREAMERKGTRFRRSPS